MTQLKQTHYVFAIISRGSENEFGILRKLINETSPWKLSYIFSSHETVTFLIC